MLVFNKMIYMQTQQCQRFLVDHESNGFFCLGDSGSEVSHFLGTFLSTLCYRLPKKREGNAHSSHILVFEKLSIG